MNAILTASAGLTRAQMRPFKCSAAKFVDAMVCDVRECGMPPHTRRMEEWRKILKRERTIRRVLMCDGRDVVFQGDPFAELAEGAVHAFCEAGGMTVGLCPYNRGWAERWYGAEWAARIAEKPIVCVGTIVAEREAAIVILERLIEEFRRHGWDVGMDTAAWQRMVWDGWMPVGLMVHANDGPVLTVGYEKVVELDAEGWIVNREGRRPAVVHQYDRHPELVAAVEARYGTVGDNVDG